MDLRDQSVERDRAAAVLAGVAWLLWQVIRWPVLALLVILEPVIRFILCGCALLGTLGAFLLKAIVHRPDVPFFGLLGLSISCVLLLALYYAAIRLFSGREGAQ